MRIVLVEKENTPEKRKAVAHMAFVVCQHLKVPIFVAKPNGVEKIIEPWDSENQVHEIVERFFV